MKRKRLLTFFNCICVIVVALFLMMTIPNDAESQKPIELKYATH
jgi:hypothetical protein